MTKGGMQKVAVVGQNSGEIAIGRRHLIEESGKGNPHG